MPITAVAILTFKKMYIYFYFSEKIGIFSSRESSSRQTIHMKCQALVFSLFFFFLKRNEKNLNVVCCSVISTLKV